MEGREGERLCRHRQIARVGFCSMAAEEGLLKLMSSAELSVEDLCSQWAQSRAGVQ